MIEDEEELLALVRTKYPAYLSQTLGTWCGRERVYHLGAISSGRAGEAVERCAPPSWRGCVCRPYDPHGRAGAIALGIHWRVIQVRHGLILPTARGVPACTRGKRAEAALYVVAAGRRPVTCSRPRRI
jgi:hypothetical protein